MYRTLRATTALVVAATSSIALSQTLFVYEGFEYDHGAEVLTLNEGAGWVSPWSSVSGGVSSYIHVNGGLEHDTSYVKLTTKPGGAGLKFPYTYTDSAGDPQTVNSGNLRRRWNSTSTPDGAVLWMSFLCQRSAGQDLSTWLALKLPANSGGDYLYLGKSESDATWGMRRHSASQGDDTKSSALATSQKVIYLVRIRFNAGNDDITVWLDPTIGQQTPPSDADAVFNEVGYLDLGVLDELRLEGGTTDGSLNIEGTIDEIRISDDATNGYKLVLPFEVKPATCTRVEHGLIVKAVEGYSLDSTVEEKWKLKAKAKTRKCNPAPARDSSDGWEEVESESSVLEHMVDLQASLNPASSYAKATAKLNVATWSPDMIEVSTGVTATATPSTEGCDEGRKKKAKAKAKASQKVKVTGNVSTTNPGLFWGRFRNEDERCRTRGKARCPKGKRDPLDLLVTDLSGVTTRYQIVDIWTAVGNTGMTSWYMQDLGDAAPRVVLENTAPDMTFRASVGSAAIPLSEHGQLIIEARHNSIITAYSDGVFAHLTNGTTAPIQVGFPASFLVDFPPFSITTQVGTVPGPGAFEFGGSSLEEDLPDSAIEIGCQIVNGLDNGFDDGEGPADTSSPESLDTDVGVAIDGFVQKVAQPFTVPSNLPIAYVEAIGLPAYQTGMPTSLSPTVPACNVEIYDGNPAMSGAVLLYSTTATAECDWADANACASPQSDAGLHPVIELMAELPANWTLNGGQIYWLVLSVQSDSNFAPAMLVPCRDHLSNGNAWRKDILSGQWSPLLDSGSGRQLSVPFDIFASDTPETCCADFNGDGDTGTDADIEAFFACLAGNCCPTCCSVDFNGDGDFGTDGDIESFFRVLAGQPC